MSQRCVRANSDYLWTLYPEVSAISDHPITTMMWARCFDTTNAQAGVVIGQVSGNQRRLGLLFRGDIGGDPVQCGALDGSGGAGSANSSTSYQLGKLHCIAGVTRSDMNRTVWLDADGEVTDTTAVLATPGVDRIQIGARYNSGAYGAFGDIDVEAVLIWNREFSRTDVREAYRRGPDYAANMYKNNLQFYYRPSGTNPRYRDLVRGRALTPVGTRPGPDLIIPRSPMLGMTIDAAIAAAAGGGVSTQRQFMLMGVGR